MSETRNISPLGYEPSSITIDASGNIGNTTFSRSVNPLTGEVQNKVGLDVGPTTIYTDGTTDLNIPVGRTPLEVTIGNNSVGLGVDVRGVVSGGATVNLDQGAYNPINTRTLVPGQDPIERIDSIFSPGQNRVITYTYERGNPVPNIRPVELSNDTRSLDARLGIGVNTGNPLANFFGRFFNPSPQEVRIQEQVRDAIETQTYPSPYIGGTLSALAGC